MIALIHSNLQSKQQLQTLMCPSTTTKPNAAPNLTNRYKLALTIKDASSTMDCIAFYNVAEELIECPALQASQNMQIEPDNQPAALKTAIGKKVISYRDEYRCLIKKSNQVCPQEMLHN